MGLYFSGVSGVWGIFGLLWVISLFRRSNLLNICMGIMILFKFANSLSLSYYFFSCSNGEIYWGLISICSYPLYHTFFISVMMMISKGYCILYEEISDSSVLTIAITLGSGYLVYSVSLINSTLLSIIVSAYIFLVSIVIIKGSRKIINLLQEKLEYFSQRRGDAKMIRTRISRYKVFQKLMYFYCSSQVLVGIAAFVIEVGGGLYDIYGWYVFESMLEVTRFTVLSMVYVCFNPFLQMNREFFILLSIQAPSAAFLQARSGYEPSNTLPSIAITPNKIDIVLVSPIK